MTVTILRSIITTMPTRRALPVMSFVPWHWMSLEKYGLERGAGLSLYNPELDIFYNYSCVCEGKKQQVLDVACLEEGNLLVATDAGLLYFDSRSGVFNSTQIPTELQKVRPRTLARYGDEVYIGSYQGLFVYSLKEEVVRTLFRGDYSLSLILAILKERMTACG